MPEIITEAEQATPHWLTATLRRAGALPSGEVLAVERRRNDAVNSAIAHLQLTYSADAPGAAPRQLLLKRNRPDPWSVQASADEVAFYCRMAPLAARLPMLLHPYDAAYDPATGSSHILLRDLSRTHATPTTRARLVALDGVPSDARLDSIVAALAGFHAYWWNHPDLGRGLLRPSSLYGDQLTYDHYVATTTTEWSRFIVAEGGRFPPELRELYEGVLPHLPALWDRHLARRILTRRHLTLCHGDCYFTQFLCPNEPGGTTYLIDWQSPRTDFAAHDLVYLFATFWTSDQRREGEREMRLLRRYQQALQAHGVTDYAWSDLLADYRLMLVYRIFLPIWDAVNGASQAYWWPKMQCLADAFRDLRCAELLEA